MSMSAEAVVCPGRGRSAGSQLLPLAIDLDGRWSLARDLQDVGSQAHYLIRDRDGKYPPLFDAILADTGIKVVLTGVRMPRTNTQPDAITCTDGLIGTHNALSRRSASTGLPELMEVDFQGQLGP
jgi:hypothetical protein